MYLILPLGGLSHQSLGIYDTVGKRFVTPYSDIGSLDSVMLILDLANSVLFGLTVTHISLLVGKWLCHPHLVRIQSGHYSR